MDRNFEDSQCPICNQDCTTTFYNLKFKKKNFSSEILHYMYCKHCDFVFSAPALQEEYSVYYSSNINDQISLHGMDDLDAIHYQQQIKFLERILDCKKRLKILDFGCGSGGLLRCIGETYPQHKLYGLDACCLHQQRKDITYINSLESVTTQFDLVIYSHVIEHLVDLDFSYLPAIVSKFGHVYFEVPDASHYTSFERKEFLYYFDRLHVNHFSEKSLMSFMNNIEFQTEKIFHGSFPYKDGRDYPSLCALFSKQEISPCNFKTTSNTNLLEQLQRYIDGEKARKNYFNKILNEVVVYGFGDNFFRARSKGGPLADVKILAIVDSDWKELSQNNNYKEYTFYDLQTAAKKFFNSDFVITISFGSGQIIEKLKTAGIDSVFTI